MATKFNAPFSVARGGRCSWGHHDRAQARSRTVSKGLAEELDLTVPGHLQFWSIASHTTAPKTAGTSPKYFLANHLTFSGTKTLLEKDHCCKRRSAWAPAAMGQDSTMFDTARNNDQQQVRLGLRGRSQ